jgi:aminoglycoside 6'-N-acetyltransferase I
MNETIEIRVLAAADASILDHVAADVFDAAIDSALTAEFLEDPRHHLAVALANGKVVGMASAMHYVHPDKAPELWINEVGVAPPYQRRGVGRRLLEALFDHARLLGCGEAWVLTEPGNNAARRLYAALGGEEEEAVYITFQLGSGNGA